MQLQTITNAIYIYLERINNLVRAQEWAICKQHDLQPVQLRMLYYLAVCNRYSRTPAGVTDYLQLTKGTVSQSLKLLETKGFIRKQSGAFDKRQVQLTLTTLGETVVAQLPPALLGAVSSELGEDVATETEAALARYLTALQHANHLQGFGVCRTCRFHRPLDEQQFHCDLTGERLAVTEAALICREHVHV
jgi:DNA-binding MarR family transcriptional regulator